MNENRPIVAKLALLLIMLGTDSVDSFVVDKDTRAAIRPPMVDRDGNSQRRQPFPNVPEAPVEYLDVDQQEQSLNLSTQTINIRTTKENNKEMLKPSTLLTAQRLAQQAALRNAKNGQRAVWMSTLTRQHWNSYVATGRGSAALFGSIDVDADGKICPSDVRVFVESVEHALSERALKLLDERVATNDSLDLHAFQKWLIDATHPEGYKSMQEHYDAHPHVGDKRESAKEQFAWNASTMSQSLRRMQYAVRGEVVIKADKLAAQGRDIIYTNIGNPHQVQQQPITYYRQVLALCDLPAANGVDHPEASRMFPADVLDRARTLRKIVGPAGTGAYTNSQGLLGVRQHVADYIAARDGHPAYTGNIFLTNGASAGIEMVLNALISSDHDGIMIPIPQVSAFFF